MCCYKRPDVKRAFLEVARKSKRKTFIAWKRINSDKTPVFAWNINSMGKRVASSYVYKSGWNQAYCRNGKVWSGKQYSTEKPNGMHVRWTYPGDYWWSGSEVILPVKIRVDDVVLMDIRQVVATRFYISPADWKYAFEYHKRILKTVEGLFSRGDLDAGYKKRRDIPPRWKKDKNSSESWLNEIRFVLNPELKSGS